MAENGLRYLLLSARTRQKTKVTGEERSLFPLSNFLSKQVKSLHFKELRSAGLEVSSF